MIAVMIPVFAVPDGDILIASHELVLDVFVFAEPVIFDKTNRKSLLKIRFDDSSNKSRP
jgi:hypothetical protein